ncbi:MAG: hypothetical protein LBE27_08925 [Deltaproteobacteria bacterium]|nr:hypothetical protein [Deltaproteobacteria bacterium]
MAFPEAASGEIQERAKSPERAPGNTTPRVGGGEIAKKTKTQAFQKDLPQGRKSPPSSPKS